MNDGVWWILGEGRVVARLDTQAPGSPQMKANAHLVASAPDLAEALDKALGTGFVLCNLREADGHDVTEARERLAACYPALAKARGES